MIRRVSVATTAAGSVNWSGTSHAVVPSAPVQPQPACGRHIDDAAGARLVCKPESQ
jgi:hypothetical protein